MQAAFFYGLQHSTMRAMAHPFFKSSLLGERGVLLELPPGEFSAQELADALLRVKPALQRQCQGVQCIQTDAAFTVLSHQPLKDPLALMAFVEAQFVEALRGPTQTPALAPKVHEFLVHYGGQHGEDLENLAKALDITPEELVSLHSQAEYVVQFIGFLPGFAYLSGLPELLHVPRLSRPRVKVPAGSLAIAAGYCAIYPWDSPGGWHLIGHVPHGLFNPANEQAPSALQVGDRVRFVPEVV